MDDDQKLTQQMNDMQAQIDALRAKTTPKESRKPSDESESMSLGIRAGGELVGSIGVAAAIGYGLDRWLGTQPWLMIVMLVLGIGTGFLNVWRTTQNVGSAVGYKNLHDAQKKSLASSDETPK